MLLKMGALTLLSVLFVVIIAAIATPFMYVGWNWGVVPAFTWAQTVSLGEAFCLTLGVSTIGGMFKSSLNINKE